MNSIPVIFADKTPHFSDLERQGIQIRNTWHGKKLPRKILALFWVTHSHFHFLTKNENGPGLCHPSSHPSKFQAELWKYDLAEFFLKSAAQQSYLEFNLAPNGSWWSSSFSKAREPAPGEPSEIPGVQTTAQQHKTFWQASASIPLSWLQVHHGFGDTSCW